MDRLQFLKNEWLPYPPAPKGWSYGRIHSLSPDKLELERFKKVESHSVSEKTVLIGTRSQRGSLQNHLRIGDWIAIQQDQVLLLAPALKKPRSFRLNEEALAHWSQFLCRVRGFFAERGFQEVSTPTVVTCPGTEPFLDPISAGQGKFLPTSPELHLKKALSMGLGPLFEIRPCFRDKEISEKHQPEFWMLEWYRPMSDLSDIKRDVMELVRFLSGSAPKFTSITMADLFQEKLQFGLKPTTAREELVALAQRLELRFKENESWDDLFNLIFVDQVEEKLGGEGPMFLENYPPSQAALARLTKDGWGDRFEFYWKGFEIANAFHELNDPEEQSRRALADNEKKMETGRSPVPIDADFLDALNEGMPPSAGIALGLERLFMCLTDYSSFSDFRVFSES